MDLREVVRCFLPKAVDAEPVSYGSGHIHDTYLIASPEAGSYILQRINQDIFKDVSALQHNMLKVSEHLQNPKNGNFRPTANNHNLQLVLTQDKRSFHTDDRGNCWRCFHFIKGSHSFDKVSSVTMAEEAGRALGLFHRRLANFTPLELEVTLPDFHNLESRYRQFVAATEADPKQRIQGLEKEVAFVKKRFIRFAAILNDVFSSGLPMRVAHNDPKINNILFDSLGKAICLIDLDTVMPGYYFHDFGDAIRTGTASAAEDETDLSSMFVRLDLFEAYCRGYLLENAAALETNEKNILYISPQIMTFIIGLRFLTDYFNGDIYFKTHRPHHNLDRWRAQKALLTSMEENENKMQQIVEDILNKK
ncbi:MAG: aminoglycoside phosphotransferase family protein [Bacteroidetes bacterium]|nr:aminoglycoside phosphotransferase family protein [Bacteroidota bacterium]